MPGLVNAHTHLAMTMFRGLADDLDLDGFLGRLMPAEGAMLSEQSVGDRHRPRRRRVPSRRHHDGDRHVLLPGGGRRRGRPDGVPVAERAGVHRVPRRRPPPVRRPDGMGSELLTATPPGRRFVCPHSTYLLAEDQLRAIGDLVAELGARVHVHACETSAELAQVAARHGGRTPIEVLRDTGLLETWHGARPRRAPDATPTSR